jgi:hypothetical protein
MAVEAPISKYKKSNLKIFIAILIIGSGWLYYDGYHNEGFIEKHTTEEGTPDDTLAFHKYFPPFGVLGAIALGGYLFAVGGKKITADDEKINIDGKTEISYDSIEKINKTDFDSKGVFIITYKGPDGAEIDKKISGKRYDNTSELLEHIVSKIS